jgi:hypothetical protein
MTSSAAAEADSEALPVVAAPSVQLSLEPPTPAAAAGPMAAAGPAPAPEEVKAKPPEDDWEISFGEDQAGRRRRDINLMAELEKLRIHVGGSPTSPRPDNADKKPKAAEPAAALDQLVAATLGGKTRPAPERPAEPPPAVPRLERAPAPSVFRFDVSLPEPDRTRLRRLVLSLRPEGPSREPLGPSKEYVVDLEGAPDAETLLLSLKVQLKGPASS